MSEFFQKPEPLPLFDGSAGYKREHDLSRLKTLLDRVTVLMSDGQWRTLAEIRERTGGSEAGISARLRDLRKACCGSRTVERQRRGDPKRGLWEYRVL